jgi:hypothetical protein
VSHPGPPSPAVDFRGARHLVERLVDVRAEMRHRAFSIWVGLFDLAEMIAGEYVIERSTHLVAEELGVSRQSWLEYRDILVAAGLLRVGPTRGPRPQVLTLTPPSSGGTPW